MYAIIGLVLFLVQLALLWEAPAGVVSWLAIANFALSIFAGSTSVRTIQHLHGLLVATARRLPPEE
jgi:hypothetical protein